jgi:uncharacterized membrane protein YkvA (DUF1232 family)
MGIKFEFELDDDDLAYFRRIVEAKRLAQPDLDVEDVIRATRDLLEAARQASTPKFILAIHEQLSALTDMVTDEDWQLPPDDVARVLGTLSYFADPADLIPDDIPGLGFLDDAVMVEIVCRKLRPELEAYADFCSFRLEEAERRSKAGEAPGAISRLDWLTAKRKELREGGRGKHGIFGRRRD